MELGEYKQEFLMQLREDAQLYGNPNQVQFVEEALSLLEKNQEIIDPIIHFCNMKGSQNRNLGFHAYSYSEADSAITLVITDFQDSIQTDTLKQSDIDALYNKMRYFIEDAYNGQISRFCDMSDDIIDIAKEFKEKIGHDENTEVTSFKFYIVTNKERSNRVKSVKEPDLLGRECHVQIWTLDRFYDNFRSSKSERVSFECKDWDVEGIQCIKANVSSSNLFDSYMGVFPGILLAKLFKKYQAPLLEGNIRCFLSAKGKINKAIKATIIGEHPENFFTYNNGLSIISNSIKLSEDGHYITAFDGFQIVNGGQTTASLTNALIKGEAPMGNLEKIFVPMKLTVLNFDIDEEESIGEIQRKQDLYNQIVHDIAKCSNSQNPTKDADFFSNDPFHREMERLSTLRENETPLKPGELNGTYWFYERSAHRWEQNTFYMTKAKRDAWNSRHPKNQLITKEKLGQYYNTIDLKPHLVCGGPVKNMPYFAKTITERLAKDKNFVNNFFFKRCVCAKIIYDTTDKIIGKADWYPIGGYKAMYVPYTISKIVSLIPEKKEIDWKLIWNKQCLYESLAHQIEIVALQTHEFLKEESNGGNERSFAVKEEVWNKYMQVKMSLTEEFINDLVDSSEFKADEQAEKKVVANNKKDDFYASVYTLGYDYWMKVYNDLERQRLLSPGYRDDIKKMAEYIKRGYSFTPKQLKDFYKAVNKIETETDYILPIK